MTAFAIERMVVDPDGMPIPAAKVLLISREGNHANPPVFYTDANGAFTCTLDQLKGFTRLLVVANHYRYSLLSTDPEAEHPTITLWPERKITGKVVDEDGTPIAGARVRVTHFSGRDAHYKETVWFAFRDKWGWDNNAVSGEDGFFTLLHVPDQNDFARASLSLRATAPGRIQREKVYGKPDIPDELAFILPRECTLTGTLYLPGKSGPAPKGVEITATSSYAELEMTKTASTDKDGRFEFRNMPPGKLRLAVAPQPPGACPSHSG